MRFTNTLPCGFLLALAINATPLPDDPNTPTFKVKHSDEIVINSAAPRCCVPTVCQCANGWFYQINQDNINQGLHGCDPPGGFIATSYPAIPGYCCREGEEEALSQDGGEISTS
ncbi:hypothetical protein ANO14919_078090 [Xylariales sp. No.14919]|nr:hypothetical protein ANO14919_078090 [Xylariales sp. No.14919]